MRPFDANGAFPRIADRDSLRRKAIRGAGVTVLSQTLAFGIQAIAIVVLARLLTPRDFGLVALVTTFSLLLLNCGLNGFTEAVLQRDTLDRFLASNLFWINAGLGALLSIGFAAAGSLLARFYAEPRVARVAAAMSLTILMNSFSVIHIALLKRAMRFSAASANDIVARAVSVLVSILLATAGWGYWALVAGAIALPFSTSIGAWSLCRWVPSPPRRGVGTGPVVRFAMSTYGRFIANYSTWNLDNLLVGWRFGPLSLGFYKKAYDLFALSASQLTAPLTSVAVSALSRLNRDPLQYRRYFLNAISVAAFVGMGLGAWLTITGKDLIFLLLGPAWEESGRIFTFFGPGIGIMLLYYTHGWIHLSIGRADRWLRWGLVEFSLTALLFLVGLSWGPKGIAVAWTLSFWILTFPALWYAGKPIHLAVPTLLAPVWKYIVASLVAACASAAITQRFPSISLTSGFIEALRNILTTSLLFAALYVGAVILLHRGFEPLRTLAGLVQEMAPRSRLSRPSSTAAPVRNPGVAVSP